MSAITSPLLHHHRGHDPGKTRYGDGDVLAVPAVRKDGTGLSIEFTIFPYRDADGSLAGVGAILRDVTKRFEEMKALRRAAAAQQRTPSKPTPELVED